MWLGDVQFDGVDVTGRLLNDPNWLKSVSGGDEVTFPLKGISDWIYSYSGRAHGAHTVNAMRRRMSKSERAEHDGAWGLDFGDPNEVRLVIDDRKPAGFFGKLFGSRPAPIDPDAEHPMAMNMVDSLKEFLKQDPSNATSADDDGLTMLHSLTMAGTARGVQTLLDHGAEINAVTKKGLTALKIARTLGWKAVAELLKQRGGK